MQNQFFLNAEVVGLLRSSADGAGPCERCSQAMLPTFLSSEKLTRIENIELKAGELTDREVRATCYDLYWEIETKLKRYTNMYRHELGEEVVGEFRIDSAALMLLFSSTTGYKRKEEVYQLLASWLQEDTDKIDPSFFGTYKSLGSSNGVWRRHPRAPLLQESMTTPTDVLCGIKHLNVAQPDYLVRAGALWALAHGPRLSRKRLVVQRVGETICVANSKYEGPLNMNSEGLQLERMLCGLPQYLELGSPEFEEYSKKQVFVVKQIPLPDGKRLCTYYHTFGCSVEKGLKGRVQVDSSEQPGNYRLRTGAAVKDTAIQMWARGQRYLHHSEWDLEREYKTIRVPVRQAFYNDPTSAPRELLGDATTEVKAGPCGEGENTDEPFEKGWIRLRVRNNNKVVRRPLCLNECLTFEQVAEQAFKDKEATDTQNKIIGHLGRIKEALDEKERSDGTEDKWFSMAYYCHRLKLQETDAKECKDIFEETNVSVIDRPLQQDGLAAYKEIVHGYAKVPGKHDNMGAGKGRGKKGGKRSTC